MKRSLEQTAGIELRLRIPWDANTAKGFAGALMLLAVLAFFVGVLPAPSPTPPTVPYDVLATITLGPGDGTGQSKGNLTLEGIKLRAPKTAQPLADAERSASRTRRVISRTNPPTSEGGRIVPVAHSERTKTSRTDTASARDQSKGGTAPQTSGDRTGNTDGTGRGAQGTGSGAGLGYGDIEWGGGGSAIVVRKVLPVAPEGLSRSTIVKLRFVVSPDGDVIDVRPMVRGVPEAESAAIRALRQWRFRPLTSSGPVVGIITFRFDVN
jgi:TonB family protein